MPKLIVAPRMHPAAYDTTKITRRFRVALPALKVLGSLKVDVFIAVSVQSIAITMAGSKVLLTIAPVTMDVFSSARPTVTAMLLCPDAANANRATIISAGTLVISPAAVTDCNEAAESTRIA